MEKIMFMPEGSDQPAAFYVLEQTKIRGISYILVTDKEEGDAECLILKDKSKTKEKIPCTRSWKTKWSFRRCRKCLRSFWKM